jgi:hypothetical protein
MRLNIVCVDCLSFIIVHLSTSEKGGGKFYDFLQIPT